MTLSDKDLETAMADLMTPAPPTLALGVLVEVGMVDRYARFDAPIGPLVVAWNGLGVSAVEAAPDDTTFEANHLARTGRRAVRADALPAALARAIERRLGGDRQVRIDLDLRGHTDFERDVWRKALEIPRGEVRPYGWIAAEIGRPKAVRAVGTALGHNPVPLIVPCHRVVRTDGSIGQYSLGGPENKRTILATEGLDPDAMEAAARSGLRYIGSDTTHVVCLPTCRHAKRVTPPHRVPFRSLAAAAGAGYRPCRVCRPASGAIAA
ncbi:MAG: methylated-DNA--[protein]-cysteine S-methyltransferase [Chloroflexi bacterium]|nr:methylated-DNA--[protein]-cysteine S-methyltransferase [Chloroflexota bacterium]